MMTEQPYAGLTIVCMASYFKGVEFIEACRAEGARVVLVVRERVREEAWPHAALETIVSVPNAATADDWVHAISHLARDRRIDRIVALEEFDVMTAALCREHLRVPGMGISTARLFRDKLAMRGRARETGIRVPEFVHVLNHAELRDFMTAVPPPWVLKPRMDVSAIGIQKLHDPQLVWHAIEALDARPALRERSSHFLLEQFIPGDVFHVDSLVHEGRVVFAGVNHYWRPPMDVAHHGGVFVTCSVPHESEEERTLRDMNRRLLAALEFRRGATHAEFIRSPGGELFFLEIAARVGGAHISDVQEAASGVNLWREWARIALAGDDRPYALPPVRRDHAGIALALARQEWPDTSAYTDPEIVYRVRRRHHVGLVVRAESYDRVRQLLQNYVDRFTDEFLAVLPPRQRAE
jgi:biotin carboxylase